jgi:hypothetical protein
LVTIDANSISTDELDVDTLVVNLSGTAPTVSALSNDTNIATTAWVNNHASSLYVTLAGASQIISSEKIFTNTFTYITGNLVSNDILSITPTTDINIGQNLTTGDIFMGTSVSTNVALNWGSSSNGGNLTFRGGTFNFFGSGLIYLRSGPTFDMNVGDTQTSGILNLGTGASRTGAINIGTGSGVRNMSIGGVSTTLALTGTVITVSGTSTSNIGNSSGSTTNIGNGSGTTTFTGSVIMSDNSTFGSSSADSIIPNGTLTKPFIIGYSTTSSFSLSSVTPVTTFLGGTLQTTNAFSNSPTGTFRYVMSSTTPYDANGGLSLSAGTYMLWFGINFEDTSTFNLTDLKMGLSTVSTLSSASSEATIVASLPNLTCYFHKTDAGDAAIADSENRVLSSCFNLASAGIVYPFYDANHSVTVDTVKVDVIITKIGSA